MNHTTPVIIVSARGDEIRGAALEAGALAVVTKPFNPSVVIEAVRTALKSKRSAGS